MSEHPLRERIIRFAYENPKPQEDLLKVLKLDFRSETQPEPSHESLEALLDTLAMLRALQVVHQNGHWNAHGDPYYGDHLLLQRLYEAVDDEMDTLAEKITSMYGAGSIDPASQLAHMSFYINDWEKRSDHYLTRSLAAEEDFQIMLKDLYTFLDEMGTLSLGMDDFIMALASDHETAVYLLRQRTQ